MLLKVLIGLIGALTALLGVFLKQSFDWRKPYLKAADSLLMLSGELKEISCAWATGTDTKCKLILSGNFREKMTRLIGSCALYEKLAGSARAVLHYSELLSSPKHPVLEIKTEKEYRKKIEVEYLIMVKEVKKIRFRWWA